MHRPFTVEWEGVLTGTPEQVWSAVTEHAAAWIWDIDYEPRVGGAERGLTGSGGTVTAWDPPRHFRTRAERPDGWHNQLDYHLEPHARGTLLRYVHQTVADAEDHDRIHEECVEHTAFYLHSLGEYVRRFAGRDATYVGVDADGTSAGVRARLGLPAGARVGDAVRLAPAGLPAIEGTIDYLTPMFLGVRGDDLLFRVYGRDAWNDPLTIGLHLFGEAVDGPGVERAWTQWMNPTEAVA